MTLAETSINKPWKRNKSIAILLAVFFGPWTWLYTFRKDAWKISAVLGVHLSILVFTIGLWIIIDNGAKNVEPGEVYDAGMAIVAPYFFLLITTLGSWLWPLIDSIGKEETWYKTPPMAGKSKLTAIILAVLVGPWTWLYTFEEDYLKCIGSILVVFGISIIAAIIDNSRLMLFVTIGVVAIWVLSIVETSVRSLKWYQSFPS